MTNETTQVKETKRTSPFRYGIGMLGTSIPIKRRLSTFCNWDWIWNCIRLFCSSTLSWT